MDAPRGLSIMPDRHPERAFRDATMRLNSRNLDHLWHTCAALSFLEREHARSMDPNSLFPLINAPRVNMFAKAILASSSHSNRTGRLGFSDFAHVYDRVNDASSDPALARALTSSTERERQFAGWLHATASSQFPYQNPELVVRLGRAYALSNSIPVRYRDVLHQALGERFFDPRRTTLDDEGTTVEDVLDVLFRAYAAVLESWKPLQALYARSSTEFRLVPGTPGPSATHQKNVLRRILEAVWLTPSISTLTFGRLRLASEAGTGLERIRNASKHVTRTTREMREALADQPHYQRGFITYRVSPLERFPLVRTHDDQFVVPVMAHLERLIGDAVHYLVQEQPHLSRAYTETRGRAQEIYLKELLVARARHLDQISERTYPGPSGEVRGPDLTLIDRQSSRLLVIESKGRRVRAETRVDVDLVAFRNNFVDAIEAMMKLPRKIQDLRTRRDVYLDYHDAIERALAEPPIGVVVVGDGTPFLTELLRLVLTDDERDGIGKAEARLMVMGLDLFETAVEIAAAGEVPLAEILDEYWEDTALSVGELARTDRPAAEFRGRTVPRPSDRFATTFADELFSRLGFNITSSGEEASSRQRPKRRYEPVQRLT